MHLHAGRESQSAGQFLRNDLVSVIAHDHMRLVLCRVEVVEQTLGVERSAGSCDGDDDFQATELWPEAPNGARHRFDLPAKHAKKSLAGIMRKREILTANDTNTHQ